MERRTLHLRNLRISLIFKIILRCKNAAADSFRGGIFVYLNFFLVWHPKAPLPANMVLQFVNPSKAGKVIIC